MDGWKIDLCTACRRVDARYGAAEVLGDTMTKGNWWRWDGWEYSRTRHELPPRSRCRCSNDPPPSRLAWVHVCLDFLHRQTWRDESGEEVKWQASREWITDKRVADDQTIL